MLTTVATGSEIDPFAIEAVNENVCSVSDIVLFYADVHQRMASVPQHDDTRV
jgi:hypothetical protein